MAPAADGVLAKEIEDELMKYTTKYDHKVEAHLVTKTNEVQTKSDVDVNITECTTSLSNELVSAALQDTTESLSSFDDCNSDDENVDTFGDSEVLPGFHDDAVSALEFDRFVDRFGRMRRKKLTTHWVSFIRPLTWRCKWVELQIKKLKSQARQYDRMLEAYNEKKWSQLDNSIKADGSRSLPFSRKNDKIDVFKRKKRMKDEATTDVTAYMSHHNLFSYFYENTKCFTENPFLRNEWRNPDNQNIATHQEAQSDDEEPLNFELEVEVGANSLLQILAKIDFLQLEVGKLKSRLYITAEDIYGSVSFAENMDKPPPHTGNGIEGAYTACQSRGSLVPRTRATSCLDVPGTSGSKGPACFEGYKRSIQVEDGDLIDNHRVKEEQCSYDQLNIQQMAWELNDGSGNNTPPVTADPIPLAKITGSIGKRKRRRKPAAGGSTWSRRSTVG